MGTCVAFNCKIRYSKKLPGITFHSFPKDETRRKLWIIAVRRANWTPSWCSKLCSAHFTEEMMDRTSFSCTRLKENAVPTIFDFEPPKWVPELKKVTLTKKILKVGTGNVDKRVKQEEFDPEENNDQQKFQPIINLPQNEASPYEVPKLKKPLLKRLLEEGTRNVDIKVKQEVFDPEENNDQQEFQPIVNLQQNEASPYENPAEPLVWLKEYPPKKKNKRASEDELLQKAIEAMKKKPMLVPFSPISSAQSCRK